MRQRYPRRVQNWRSLRHLRGVVAGIGQGRKQAYVGCVCQPGAARSRAAVLAGAGAGGSLPIARFDRLAGPEARRPGRLRQGSAETGAGQAGDDAGFGDEGSEQTDQDHREIVRE